MRVLVDIVHPAHVHFFRHLYAELMAEGSEVHVVSRHKEVTVDLLDRFGIPHEPVGRAATGSSMERARELVTRVGALRRAIRSFRPDFVLTRNPSGVQAARFTPALGIFDTDDGKAVGVHFYAAYPFAGVITTPTCLRADYGRRHYRYPGYKALAYLHPDRFQPDPGVKAELGLAEGERLFVVRFSAHTASHDSAVSGLPLAAKRLLLAELSSRGRVVLTDESSGEREFDHYKLPVPPDRLHDILAAADLCVGDSQTVAAEAAVLGTPAFRLSSFSGRVDYLRDLEERFGLVHNYRPGEETSFVGDVVASVGDLEAVARRAAEARTRMLREAVDVTAWYRELLHRLASRRRS